MTLLVGLAVLALAFFVVPTRVHERYGYPFFALGAILAAVSVRWRLAYVVLSVATLANMYVVLTTLYPDNPSIADWFGIGPTLRSEVVVTVIAVAHGLAFLWVLVQLRRGALDRLTNAVSDVPGESLDLEPEPRWSIGAFGEPTPDLEPADTPPVPLLPATAGAAGSAAAAALDASPDHLDAVPSMSAPLTGESGSLASPDEPDAASGAMPPTRSAPSTTPAMSVALPTWHARRSFTELGFVGWLRSRLFTPPIRPDRTAALAGEGGGRLDRFDLYLVVLLVVGSLFLRTFRLAEPYQMHFDEVYHARTAAEFLQDWRYGIDHDIYEWTHPHLAKYAMAAGLVLWGGDHVQATNDLGVPVRAAVDRAPSSAGRRARRPDRRAAPRRNRFRDPDLRPPDASPRSIVAGARGHRAGVRFRGRPADPRV